MSKPKPFTIQQYEKKVIMKKKNIHRNRNIAVLKDGTTMHYYDYIKSIHWENVKNRYRKSKLKQNCVCGSFTRIVFHHLTYKRLGHERLWDIIPLCWDCHNKTHDNHQNSYNNWISKSLLTIIKKCEKTIS